MKYSVVIPLYNKEEQILRTIDSVINQSFKEFEVIVVDDGSTDNGHSVVKNYDDSRIIIIKQRNAGVSVARNRGIEEAQAPFIAFLDADDEWEQEYLGCIDFLTSSYPECDVFACSWAFKDGSKVHRPRFKHIPAQHGILEDYVKSIANGDSPLWTSSVVVRKSIFNSVNMFDVNSTMGEDIDLWYRLSLKTKIAFFNKTLSYYNVGSQNRLCKKTPIKETLPYFNLLIENINKTKSYTQKYYLKKFFSRSIHNISKNYIKQGEIGKGISLIFQAPFVINMETFKCLAWFFLFFLKHNRDK